ncbi:MAG: Stp1/IreP family PP2C-type Ser/Thr phosphatase [Ilumatobacteraceae bacterium]
MAEIRSGSCTHEGRLRTQNEDHAHSGDGLFIVADGMGGHLAGEIASEMAVDTLRSRLTADRSNRLTDLVDAIAEANLAIYHDSIDDPNRTGMGTTVTAVAVISDSNDGEELGIANVGDSRTYLVRHGRLRQLTIDHSYVQELVAEGAITRDEARDHPRRNIVTRALGIEPVVPIDAWSMPIIRGDRLVLCSDGLVDEVHDDTILEILLAHADDPQGAAEALVDAANEAGGRDNTTVVVLDILDGDEPPEPTEEIDVVPTWNDDADPSDGSTGTADAASGSVADDDSAAVIDPERTGAERGDAERGDARRRGTERPGRPSRHRSRGTHVRGFMIAIGVGAVFVVTFAVVAAWARQGYFVAFDDDDNVVIYQGRELLWFQPTAEAPGKYGRNELDDESIGLVEARPEFETQASAADFVAFRLTTTTTTTTSPPTTTSPSTSTTTSTSSPSTTTPGDGSSSEG